MANRLLLDATGLKVSKPGANVLTMTPRGKDVSFDSRWTESSRIVISGAQNVSNGSTTVNYGRTLSQIPSVYILGRTTSDSSWVAITSFQAAGFINYGENQSASKQQAQDFFDMVTSPPNGVVVHNNRFVINVSGINRISYVVFAYG